MQVLIFSYLEVDFAIIGASMPFFWPTVKAAWSQITVTRVVIVTSESRYDEAHKDDLGMNIGSTVSLRSHNSIEGLVTGESGEGNPFYIDSHSESRALQIPPLAQTTRSSTPLRG